MRKTRYINAKIFTAANGFINEFYCNDGIFTFDSTRAAETVDLGGKTVVPGFIDSHTHILPAGLNSLGLDLRQCRSLNDLFETVADHCSAHAHRQVLFAFGFDESKIKEQRFPTQDELRNVTGNKPFFIKRVDMHSMMVNQAFERDYNVTSDNGIIRGQDYDAAIVMTQKRFNDQERAEALDVMERKAFNAGITSLHTMEGYLDDYSAIDFHLKNKNKFSIDYIVYPQVMNVPGMKERGFDRIGGCILLDGSIGSHTAAVTLPYADDADNMGKLYLDNDKLFAFCEEAHCAGMQLSFHAIGDRAVAQITEIYEHILTKHPKTDHRHRIEHAILVTDRDFDRLAKLGIWLDYQPIFEYLWGGHGKLYETRLGASRIEMLHRIKKTQTLGIPFAFGSDCDVTPLDPLTGIHAAVNRDVIGQAVDVISAVQAFTIDAARIGFTEKTIGSIEEGKQADFTVLANDIFSCPPSAIKDAGIFAVYKKGDRVFSSQ